MVYQLRKFYLISLLVLILCQFLFAQDKPIIFTYPSKSNTFVEEIVVKGVVIEDTIKNVELSVTNLWDLIETPEKVTGSEPKSVFERLSYIKIPVKNMGFSGKVKLKVGMNAIIALPEGKEKSKGNVVLKVIIYDIKDNRINLLQPRSEQMNDLREISGLVKDNSIDSVSITIKAMLKKKVGKEYIYKVEQILDKTVKLEKGKFSLPVKLPEDVSDKGALIIYLKAGDYNTTKTLY